MAPYEFVVSLKHGLFQALLFKTDDDRVYVTWLTPFGFRIRKWSDYKNECEPLLKMVRDYCEDADLNLWSY